MRFRFSLPITSATATSFVLAASMFAQQVPNPVLPPSVGSGDGLTRDALDTPPAASPAPTSTPAARTSSTARRSAQARGSRKTPAYATINHHRRKRHVRRHQATMVASASATPARRRAAAKPRAPLVSFIYWWNGWVMRTFHTRSGTVLLDTIGAKS